jgi:hypothetical protein
MAVRSPFESCFIHADGSDEVARIFSNVLLPPRSYNGTILKAERVLNAIA